MKLFGVFILILHIFCFNLFASNVLPYIGKDKLNRPVVKDQYICYAISGDEVMTRVKCNTVIRKVK